MKKNKVVFYIMNKRGLDVLTSVVNKFGQKIVEFVVSSQDNNVIKDYYDEIYSTCINNKILFYDRKEGIPETDHYIIAIGWRWLIESSENKLIVFHDSLLPRYRGFAPLVNSLINKEDEIGVTALFASSEYDRGDIIHQESAPVKYPVKIASAIEIVSGLYQKTALLIIGKIHNEELLPQIKQDELLATYSMWRDEQDYEIDWCQDSEYILNFVNAVGFPYKGAKTTLAQREIRVHEVEIYPDVKIENRAPGKTIFLDTGKPVVACGSGLIKVLEATYSDSGKPLLPLSRFKCRFV